MDDNRLAELLLEKKILSPPQLMNARSLQKQTGGSLQQLIVKLNYAKSSDLNNLIAQDENLHAVEVKIENIHIEALKKIPQKIIDKYCVLPLKAEEEDSETVILAMADPNNYQALEEIQFLTGLKIEEALAPREDLSKAINYYYNHKDEIENEIREKQLTSVLEDSPSLNANLDQILHNHSQKEILKSLIKVLLQKESISIEELVENLE